MATGLGCDPNWQRPLCSYPWAPHTESAKGECALALARPWPYELGKDLFLPVAWFLPVSKRRHGEARKVKRKMPQLLPRTQGPSTTHWQCSGSLP